MKKVLNIYKPIGATPYQMVENLKKTRMEYAESTISYAGRLDPMAEGVLILLVDEGNKKREKYQGLDKEYEFEVLLGLETDTYDLLGIVENTNASQEIPNSKSQITKKLPRTELMAVDFIEKLVGRRVQKYPPYSSYTIDGKPLFQWAKEGKIGEIELPEKEIVIYESEFLGKRTMYAEELYKTIIKRVSKVEGEFRQGEILKRWRMFFERIKRSHSGARNSDDETIESTFEKSQKEDSITLRQAQGSRVTPIYKFNLLKFRIICSSGTYVRQIAHKLGKIAGTGALCFHIKRTRVGKYTLKDSVPLLF